MSMDLHQKVTLVTGASSGLGRRFSVDLAGAGAVVIGLSRRADLMRTLGEELQGRSPKSEAIVCDVTDIDGFLQILRQMEDRHGRIDVLVNNAGMGEAGGDSSELAFHRRLMETNYFAAVAGTLAVLPGMRQRGGGVIVNVSSDSGRAPGPREVAYGASKAALSAFTESLAFQVEGSGVHLHVLYPGWVATPMGQGAVDAGMPTPPRMVRRTEEQISQLLLSRMGRDKIDIDATLAARFAPVARVLFPRPYRRSLRKAAGL
jgi:NAD(P)-dependent dehydrogenase (short-subunit alcohol dehydrogenase family)